MAIERNKALQQSETQPTSVRHRVLAFPLLRILAEKIFSSQLQTEFVAWDYEKVQRDVRAVKDLENPLTDAKVLIKLYQDVQTMMGWSEEQLLQAIKESESLLSVERVDAFVQTYAVDPFWLKSTTYVKKQIQKGDPGQGVYYLEPAFGGSYRYEAVLQVLVDSLVEQDEQQRKTQAALKELIAEISNDDHRTKKRYYLLPINDTFSLSLLFTKYPKQFRVGIFPNALGRMTERTVRTEQTLTSEVTEAWKAQARECLRDFIHLHATAEDPFIWEPGILAHKKPRKNLKAFLKERITDGEQLSLIEDYITLQLLDRSPQAISHYRQAHPEQPGTNNADIQDSAVYYDERNNLCWQLRVTTIGQSNYYQTICWKPSEADHPEKPNLLSFPL